jgi:hypothetical protein
MHSAPRGTFGTQYAAPERHVLTNFEWAKLNDLLSRCVARLSLVRRQLRRTRQLTACGYIADDN